MRSSLASDIADLVLGRACHLCHRPGPVLCPECVTSITKASVSGAIDGRPVFSCGPYAGHLRTAILHYKEGGTRALAPSLAALLATSISAAATVALNRDLVIPPLLVVPTPGHPNPPRGFEALATLMRHAETHLDARTLTCTPILRSARRYAPVKGLGRLERLQRVSGSMRASCVGLPSTRAILVDDVLTTGATVREGIRALSDAHIDVVAIAVLASPGRPATRRESAPATRHRQIGRPDR
jgi:predicted amidophosphoribosyltransferase